MQDDQDILTEIKIIKPKTKVFLAVLFLVLIILIKYYTSNYNEVLIIKDKFTTESAEEIAEEIYTNNNTELVKNLPINDELKKKLEDELLNILAKDNDFSGCEVYFLKARFDNYYPILAYANIIIGFEFLKIGEVWKVGMTKNGEIGRYPIDIFYKNNNIKLTRLNLLYKQIYNGSYKECLILEKILIYTYPLWSGHPELIKPPGCKIFR